MVLVPLGNGTSTYENKQNLDYNTSKIKTYVDKYVTYLKNQFADVSGRLITVSELYNVMCMNETECIQLFIPNSAPEWTYQTSFWTADTNNEYGNVISTNKTHTMHIHDEKNTYGVRPLIVLKK